MFPTSLTERAFFAAPTSTNLMAAGPKTDRKALPVEAMRYGVDDCTGSVVTACDRGAQALMRMLELISRLHVRSWAAAPIGAVAALSMTGCYGGASARADYYNSRAIESQAHEGDGSIVVVSRDSNELREAILRARRVQLAEVDTEK